MLKYVGALFMLVGTAFLLVWGLLVFDVFRYLTWFAPGEEVGDQWVVVVAFAILGLLLNVAGFWLIRQYKNQHALEEDLKANGQRILADFVSFKRGQISLNGKWSQRIVSQWTSPKDNKKYEFESADIWFDVIPFSMGDKVTVYIDPSNPKRYFVQLAK